MAILAEARHAWRAADRRCGRHAQLRQDQRHTPGDPLRHARGGTRRRSTVRVQASTPSGEPRRAARSCARFATSSPPSKRGLWFALLNAGFEAVTFGKAPWTLKNHADWSTLKKLDEYTSPDRGWVDRKLPPRDRLASVFFAGNVHDEVATRTPQGRGHFDLRRALHEGIWQSVRELLSRRRVRDGARRQAVADVCRSTLPTASTARPATSRIPTRSSRGRRPKAARGRITRICSRRCNE